MLPARQGKFHRSKVEEWKHPSAEASELMYAKDVPPGTTFYHGTKAYLQLGDLLAPGCGGSFAERGLSHIYFSATLEAATWGAELAKGEGRGRIYIVEPTGPFEDDPNLTDNEARKPAGGRLSTAVFPVQRSAQACRGQGEHCSAASYRSRDPLRVTGEGEDWFGHSPEQVQAMRDGLARLAGQGAEILD